jgi:hypothetical protein
MSIQAKKYKAPFLSTIGERSLNPSPHVSGNGSQNGSILRAHDSVNSRPFRPDSRLSNSRPTSRISDSHVQIPMSGGQASNTSSADSKDTSTSLLHLLFWNIAVFTSIQVSRYGSLANSFINATPAIITCGVWRFNGVFRVWAGVSFFLTVSGANAVGQHDIVTSIMNGTVTFVAGIMPYIALSIYIPDRMFNSRARIAFIILCSSFSAGVSTISELYNHERDEAINMPMVVMYHLLNHSVWSYILLGL